MNFFFLLPVAALVSISGDLLADAARASTHNGGKDFLHNKNFFFSSSESGCLKKIHANMVIGDYVMACEEARRGLQTYPESKQLWCSYIKAIAKSGDEKSMLHLWHQFTEKYPEERTNSDILECLAWAVLEKGAVSSSPAIRVIAMLGACFSQDAKGVAILQKGLLDENSFLRIAAIKLSTMLFDTSLQEQILHLFKNEKAWNVRLEAIHAVGDLRIVEARKGLLEIISDNNSHAEEKAAAIEALVSFAEGISRQQLSHLVLSDRAGMRLLACEFIAYFDQIEDIDLLLPLFSDPHGDVRAKAFETAGLLRVLNVGGYKIAELAFKGITDPNPIVAISAAWTMILHDQKKGMEVLESFLNNRTSEIQYLAASALAATGKYGVPLAKKIFNEHPDPYVRMNLALGLIGQREDVDQACDSLYEGLLKQKERWAWRNQGYFRMLAPSQVRHDESMPNYPEAVNQITRLEVLEILAIVKYPDAQQAIKSFLQERTWGISGLAAALLLTEGDEDAADIVQDLVHDSDQRVKVQAALILALWGKGDEVVRNLKEAYETADREMKAQILEGIGRVGTSSSLSFLADRLKEPYQTLRIVSAAALLECLYH